MANDVNTGKFISLVLRHNPDAIGIKLDQNGWANTTELLEGLRQHGTSITMTDLERIVENNDKHRYSFNDDKTKIRANQGHSIEVDVELKEAQPPEVLYHGTAEGFMGSIDKEGLDKKKRLHVHMTENIETAKKSGARYGKPVVLEVNSGEMYRAGFKFYIAENNVWLTKHVPVNYITRKNM